MKEIFSSAAAAVKSLYEKAAKKASWAIDIYRDMLSDYKANKEKSAARPYSLISSIAYFLLIFVVIYGAGDHVYDGFGALAPWLVGGIFLAMSILRGKRFVNSFMLFANRKNSDKNNAE